LAQQPARKAGGAAVTTELKPCPFCGGTELKIDYCSGKWYVACAVPCAALGPDGDTENAAIEAWNKRTITDDDQWNELRRLYDAVEGILMGLDPQEFNEAINWGDLGPAEVTRTFDQDHRMWLRVVIEEAAPGCEKLIAAVSAALTAQGWTGVQIDTQW
jgi:Lar family restriction alleviation protein